MLLSQMEVRTLHNGFLLPIELYVQEYVQPYETPIQFAPRCLAHLVPQKIPEQIRFKTIR